MKEFGSDFYSVDSQVLQSCFIDAEIDMNTRMCKKEDEH